MGRVWIRNHSVVFTVDIDQRVLHAECAVGAPFLMTPSTE